MKLSDLLKPKKSISDAYAPGGFFSTQPAESTMLQQSINKSTPAFKATTTTQSGEPIAKPSTPAAARTDLQGVDYYTNLYQNASKPETKAASLDWLTRNAVDYGTDTVMDESATDTIQSDGMVEDTSGIDFSTPTSNVAYSMEKLNELYGTKSPEDLWALRQKLRFQQSQASAGMLPEEEYMGFSGEGITDGAPRYNYDQRMAVNRATADIFGTQVSDLDKFMNDFSKGESASASAGTDYSFGSNPALDIILGSGKFTKDQKNLIIGSIQSGQDPTTVILNQARTLMANPVATDVSKTQQGLKQLKDVQSALQEFYAAGGDTSLLKGNYEKVLNRLGKTKDPKLVEINSRIQKALQKYRNAVSGTAYSVQEGADIASIFPGIQKGKELNDVLVSAGIDSLQSDIDTAYEEVLGSSVYQSLISGNNSQSSGGSDETFEYNGQMYKLNPDGTADLVSFKNVGSGTNKAPKVVAGYDISSYATDPQHEAKVARIYQSTPAFRTPQEIDMVIRKVAPKSRITGQMVATAANTYGVDPKMVYAMMLQDSSLGTAGMGARNNNPGNIGQFDNLSSPVKGYETLQDGVNAVAKWLSRKKVNQNYA